MFTESNFEAARDIILDHMKGASATEIYNVCALLIEAEHALFDKNQLPAEPIREPIRYPETTMPFKYPEPANPYVPYSPGYPWQWPEVWCGGTSTTITDTGVSSEETK